MRIGNVIIDTDVMCSEELTVLINELRNIRKRKLDKENFEQRMRSLIEEAHNEGFDFTDKNFGYIWENDGFLLYETR